MTLFDPQSQPQPFGTSPIPTAEELNNLLPDYHIEHFIAVGKAGAVYKAKQLKLDRYVALKILPASFYHNARFRHLFEHDFKALGCLNHDNITKVYEQGSVGEMLYMATEFVDGITFHDFLQNRLLTKAETAHFTMMLCDALSHAHSKGIVHGAVRGRNLMITQNYELKLVDFSVGEAHDLIDGGQDFTGNEYRAPEYSSGSADTDFRVDIYALGVFMMKCLTGVGPQLYNQAGTPGIHALGPFKQLIYHCLRSNPGDRMGSIELIRTQLAIMPKETQQLSPIQAPAPAPAMPAQADADASSDTTAPPSGAAKLLTPPVR